MEHVKKAIEEFTGNKILKMKEVYVYEGEWKEHYPDLHITMVDGDCDWDWRVSNWNAKKEAEIVIVFQSEYNPEEVVLLREIGVKDKDGKAYHDLDGWLPEVAFGQGIWNEKQKIEMLRQAYYDTALSKNITFYGVCYDVDNDEELTDSDEE